MRTNSDIIHEAIFQFQEMTKIPAEIENAPEESFPYLRLGNIYFTVKAKTDIRGADKGFILSEIEQLQQWSSRPVIIIAKYLTHDVAGKFRDKGINYIDIAGNAFINENNVFVFISGQKTPKTSKKGTSRAFREVGIKLIFQLLMEPGKLKRTHREMAEFSGISIGSVNNIIKELIELHFILRTRKKLVLKNTNELLHRWTLAYNDIVRPRILKKRMRYSDKKDYRNWRYLPIDDIEGINLWGGEPAATILTKQLQPKIFTIYTSSSWQNVARTLKLIPDENGDIEILTIFWNEGDDYRDHLVSPALLVYADLIGSGYERNIQIAKEIFKNELQHIQ